MRISDWSSDVCSSVLSPTKAELVGFSLAVEPGEGCYVPVGHIPPGGGGLDLGGHGEIRQIPLQDALAVLKPLLADPGVLKIGQNIKYDMAVLAGYGVDIVSYDDTMLLSYTLAAGKPGHGMGEHSDLTHGHKPHRYAEDHRPAKAP